MSKNNILGILLHAETVPTLHPPNFVWGLWGWVRGRKAMKPLAALESIPPFHTHYLPASVLLQWVRQCYRDIYVGLTLYSLSMSLFLFFPRRFLWASWKYSLEESPWTCTRKTLVCLNPKVTLAQTRRSLYLCQRHGGGRGKKVWAKEKTQRRGGHSGTLPRRKGKLI